MCYNLVYRIILNNYEKCFTKCSGDKAKLQQIRVFRT